MELRKSQLRYLLVIYEQGKINPDVGTVAIAKALGCSKASVTKMMTTLMDMGLLVRERYGKIYLTDTGFLMAKRLSAPLERYAAQLQQEFSLSDDEAWNAACAAICSLPEEKRPA